ncbi:MAG: tetratricopeptide repeat protein [Planctomycetota bacterium]
MPESVRVRSQSWDLLFACAVLIAGVVTFAHWPALEAEALSFDDHQYLVGNPLVMTPSWASARRFMSEVFEPSTVGGYYQPLNMISLMGDVALGAGPTNLRPLHRTSLILHVVNTMLVLVLLHDLFGSLLAATVVALLFGVHPLTVEAIPWVGERKTLLASFFALGSLIFYVRYTRSVGTSKRRGWYVLCLVAFLLALLSKPTTTTLPLAMMLLDVWPLGRSSRRTLIEKVPFLALAAVSSVITFVSQAASYVQTPGEVGPWRIPLVVCHNIVFYLWKIVWPTNLSSHYPFPEPMSLSQPMVLAGVIGTGLLMLLLVVTRRWTAAPLIGWLIFFVLIFPTLGVVGFTIVIASDKYAYLPSVGLLMILCAGLTRHLTISTRPGSRTPRIALVCVATLALVTLEVRATRTYFGAWRTTESLYAHMLGLAPRAATLHFGLGHCHETRGRIRDAIQAYATAIECDPRHVHARNNLALLLADEGRFAEAIAHYETVLTQTPGAPDVLSNLALALTSSGRPDDAIQRCREALQKRPTEVRAINNWGVALSVKGDWPGAIAKFEEALRVNDDFADARNNLAAGLWRVGRLDEAVKQYREVIRRAPEDLAVRLNLARLLVAMSRFDAARLELEATAKLRPGDPDVQRLMSEIQNR